MIRVPPILYPLIIIVTAILVYILLSQFCNAQMYDDFNFYDYGQTLKNQVITFDPDAAWISGNYSENFFVASASSLYCKVGNCAGEVSSLSTSIFGEISSSDSGTQYFWMRQDQIHSEYGTCAVYFANSSATGMAGICFGDEGKIYSDANCNTDEVGEYEGGEFFLVTINYSDNKFKVKINDGSWSDEFDYYAGGDTSFHYISLWHNGNGTNDLPCYWDQFTSIPQTYDTDTTSIVEEYLSDKFPFVYFYQISDIIDVISSTTASATYGFDALTMTIPATQMLGSQDLTFHLVSLSYLYKVMSVDQWNIFKDLLRGAIYFSLVFYFFRRLQSIFGGSSDDSEASGSGEGYYGSRYSTTKNKHGVVHVDRRSMDRFRGR